MKKVLFVVAAILGLNSDVQAQTPFFQDNFDNGAKTNLNGFRWTDASAVAVTDANAFSGNHALQFRFGPNAVGKDAWAEQRFDMGKYLNEVWIEYMLFVPSNFMHRNDGPSNNKFLRLWRDSYANANTQSVGMEFDPTVAKGLSGPVSAIRPMAKIGKADTTGMPIATLGAFKAGNRGPDGKTKIKSLIAIGPTHPIALGKWTRIRFHFKLSSARLKSDGVYQMWANDSLLVNAQNQPFWNARSVPADASFRNGYLLGWANSGFTDRTLLFIDDVKFYDSNPNWK